MKFRFKLDGNPFDKNGEIKLGEYHIPSFLNTNSPVCVECGVGIGGFIKKNANNFAQIYSFEACYSNFVSALKLIEENNIENAAIFNFAVCDVTGNLVKIKAKSIYGCSTVFYDKEDVDYHNVFSISLEDIFNFIEEPRIHYLKVDIEGAEYGFLMNKNLEKIDVIAIEIHKNLLKEHKKLTDFIKRTHKLIWNDSSTNQECLFLNRNTLNEFKFDDKIEKEKLKKK